MVEVMLDEGYLGNEVTIAVCQLKEPDIVRVSINNYPCPHWEYKCLEDRRYKINAILNELARMGNIDIVVFPEYSVPEECVKELYENFRHAFKIIICGSDVIRTADSPYFRKNTTPVIVGDCVYYIVKGELSEREYGLVDPSESLDDSILKLTWRIEDEEKGEIKECEIVILVCKDFLDIYEKIPTINPKANSIIIVPMNSRSIEEFVDLSKLLIRDNSVVILCNSSAKTDVGEWVGGSSIIGVTYDVDPAKPFVCQLPTEVSEGVIISKINLLNLGLPKVKPLKKIGYTVICSGMYEVLSEEDSVTLKFIAPIMEMEKKRIRGILNPVLLSETGRLMKIYIGKASSYIHSKEEILETNKPLTAFTTLGEDDIIIVTFCKSDEFGEEDLRSLGLEKIKSFTVITPYLFFGHETKPINHKVMMNIFGSEEEKGKLLRALKGDLQPKEMKALEKDNLILGIIERKELSGMRFFTFIGLEGSPEIFERHILLSEKILSKHGMKVLSIFKLRSETTGVHYDYLIDIIAENPDSVNEFIDGLYYLSNNYSPQIKIRTSTYFAISCIKDSIFEVLYMLRPSLPMLQKAVYELIKQYTPELELEDIDSQIVEIFKKFFKRSDKFPETRDKLIKFLIMLATNKQEDVKQFKGLFLDLFGEVERTIRSKLEEAVKTRYDSPLEFQQDLKLQKSNIRVFTAAQLVEACKKWSKKFDEVLLPPNVIEEFEKVIPIRNSFAHERIEEIEWGEVIESIICLMECVLLLKEGGKDLNSFDPH